MCFYIYRTAKHDRNMENILKEAGDTEHVIKQAAELGLTRKEIEAAGERAPVWNTTVRGRAHGNKV